MRERFFLAFKFYYSWLFAICVLLDNLLLFHAYLTFYYLMHDLLFYIICISFAIFCGYLIICLVSNPFCAIFQKWGEIIAIFWYSYLKLIYLKLTWIAIFWYSYLKLIYLKFILIAGFCKIDKRGRLLTQTISYLFVDLQNILLLTFTTRLCRINSVENRYSRGLRWWTKLASFNEAVGTGIQI